MLDLIPPAQNHSIERAFFPALLSRGDLVRAHVHRGYWIDIGTPEKYRQVHRDILAGRFPVDLDGERGPAGWIHPRATVSREARLVGPVYLGPGVVVAAGTVIGPDAVLVDDVLVGPGASVSESVLWAGCRVDAEARVGHSLLGPGVRVLANARLRGAVLGEGTIVSSYSVLENESA